MPRPQISHGKRAGGPLSRSVVVSDLIAAGILMPCSIASWPPNSEGIDALATGYIVFVLNQGVNAEDS